MKRVFSIVMALALVLTMMVASAAPAGACIPNTVQVVVANPMAEELSAYTVSFQSGGLYLGNNGDYIDITFPVGTDITGIPVPGEPLVGTAATRALAVAAAVGGGNVIGASAIVGQTVRFTLTAGSAIAANAFVAFYFPAVAPADGIINPVSCDYSLYVDGTVCCGSASPLYTIWTASITLNPGKNLISLPAYPADPSIEIVLRTLFTRAALPVTTTTPLFTFSVWYWDSHNLDWIKYVSDTSFADLTTLEAGKAYWIKVSATITFLFKGTVYPPCQGPPQKWCYPASWSMIGIPTTTPTAASQYLWDAMLPWPSHNTYAVSKIYRFESTATLVPEGNFFNTGWVPGQRDQLPWVVAPYVDVVLQPGVGYFMSFLGDACIIPPVPLGP